MALNLAVSFLLLLAAIRYLGVSKGELSTVVIFATFAAAFLAGTLIPLTAGGLGVVDIAIVAGLASARSADTSVLIAAVFAWRIFYDLITIPIGVITITIFTRSHPDLLRTTRADLVPPRRPST